MQGDEVEAEGEAEGRGIVDLSEAYHSGEADEYLPLGYGILDEPEAQV